MEYLPSFRLHRPTSVEEALSLSGEGTRWLAGGTDLVVNTRRGIESPSALIDLAEVAELAGIAGEGDGLRIGAGTRLAEIAGDARVQAGWTAVAEAAAAGSSPRTVNWSPTTFPTIS